MKVLVLTSEPLTAQRLRSELGDDARDAEVMVVAPALHESALRFWMSDADDAIARAQKVQRKTVSALEREGVEAHGDTGESDPFAAAADALTDFDADRILIFEHPDDERAYQEEVDASELEQRFGRPVTLSLVKS